MKYTDKWFAFPMRLYDAITIEEAEEKERVEKVPQDIDFAIAIMKIPHEEIKAWHEVFDRPLTVEDVKGGKFNCTRIFTENLGEWTTTWDIKRFESRLNEHKELLDKEFPTKVPTKRNGNNKKQNP